MGLQDSVMNISNHMQTFVVEALGLEIVQRPIVRAPRFGGPPYWSVDTGERFEFFDTREDAEKWMRGPMEARPLPERCRPGDHVYSEWRFIDFPEDGLGALWRSICWRCTLLRQTQKKRMTSKRWEQWWRTREAEFDHDNPYTDS